MATMPPAAMTSRTALAGTDGTTGADGTSSTGGTDTASTDGSDPCDDVAGLATVSTDATISSLAAAAASFRGSLSDDLLSQARFCLDDAELYSWSNLPAEGSARGGITMGDLTDAQKTSLDELMKGFLSDAGFEKFDAISGDIEGQLEVKNADVWSPDYYTLALFQTPERHGSWAIQFDGHHLAVNLIVDGDRVRMTPTFLGAEPKTTTGGVNVFESEEDLAFALMALLDDAQKAEAVFADTALGEIETSPGNQSTTDDGRNYDYSNFDGVGLLAADMSDDQKAALRALIEDWVGFLEADLAAPWLAEIESSFDTIRFAWAGPTEPGGQIYYRIYSDAILVEFDHNAGVAGNADTTDHIHSVLRDPGGQDYSGFASAAQKPGTIADHYKSAEHHRRRSHRHGKRRHSH